MRGILVFDQLNDILFTKCDSEFLDHMRKLAVNQGLLSDDVQEIKEKTQLSPNVVIQLFSPMVTSQRVMSCQFGNSYTSIQCQDGKNLVFDEYMGYLFMHIGGEMVDWLKRMLGVCIAFVKYLCGPDVSLLKLSQSRSDLLTQLLDTWLILQDSEQWLLIEAVEQLTVNTELSNATLRTLQDAVEKMRTVDELQRVHAMILVRNKFLSLYSSKNTQDLASPDIVFLTLLTETVAQHSGKSEKMSDSGVNNGESSDEYFSPSSSPISSRSSSPIPSVETLPLMNESVPPVSSVVSYDLVSHLVLLGSIPHAVHMAEVAPGVTLLLIVQTQTGQVCGGLSEALQALHVLQAVQVQKDIDGIKMAFEALDSAVKHILDGMRKIKNATPAVESCVSKVQSMWDFLRRKYHEYIKSGEQDCLLRIESTSSGFSTLLCELLSRVCLDSLALHAAVSALESAANYVRRGLHDFSSFLQVKALRNFTLGSRASLTINKYLEEFPGLVHFIYVDRSNHRVIAPSLDFSSQDTKSLTKKKIWWMVGLSRSHLQDGHLSMMWKDTTFNYAYFVWFEDGSGSPLKPKVFPSPLLKNFPLPGIICGDFYQKLVETCFPKSAPKKVRCFELLCVHLGLATSSCVLEHTRRLAATIWEVTGVPGSPLDLL